MGSHIYGHGDTISLVYICNVPFDVYVSTFDNPTLEPNKVLSFFLSENLKYEVLVYTNFDQIKKKKEVLVCKYIFPKSKI